MAGYVYCSCRDCFEIIVGHPGDFCDECIDAGCRDNRDARLVDGKTTLECQRLDAYGDDGGLADD